jgi:hypothetical protein
MGKKQLLQDRKNDPYAGWEKAIHCYLHSPGYNRAASYPDKKDSLFCRALWRK